MRLLKGEDFEELAKELTDDVAGKQNGGGLGYFARGKMVKPFADAAFSMSKVGEISPVVATPFGYHVIRYEGRKLPEPIPYDKVKDKIINQLQIDMGNKVWQDKIIALRSDSSIKIDQAIMDQLTQEYRAVPPEPAQ